MKTIFNLFIVLILISNFYSSKVHAFEEELSIDNTQIIIANKYAEKFCDAKDDNFFEGLDNERTLKYSYFRYIGLKNKEIYSKAMYETLIHQIREKCILTNKEEREIYEFFLDNKIFKQ
tara:strand:- start:109 stop:465 length:357 start_codon:yes stop_codon:yes gene_type:complete